ncbi:MAG: endonuclease MutS2 [bacterium]
MIEQLILNKLEFVKVLEYNLKFVYTENGKELLLNSLPLKNASLAQLEGSYVTEAKEILIHNDIPPINYLPNLTDAIVRSKIEGVRLNINQVLDILNLLEISRNLVSFLKSKPDAENINKNFTGLLYFNKVLEQSIRSIFNENKEISDHASPKLREIRNEIREKNDRLQRVVNKILKQLSESSYVQEEYMTISEGRIVLPIKAEHKRHVKGFIHSESASGQTVYIEPAETLDLNNDILSLSFAEKREIDQILSNLTKKIGEVSLELKNTLYIISKIDTIFAKARYSIDIDGCFPTIFNDKPLFFIDARHPILLKKYGKNKTIPLNFKIDKNIITLITGPNAGGKTVVLKTVGLLELLVLSGFHVPIHVDSNLHFFENMIIDIGDEQSIETDLSTFSSHLANYKKILDFADDKTLVLLDEIGTGTDPEEGGAIAATILQRLKNSSTKTLATTHLGKLKILANDLEGFQNASMEYDSENLAPTYLFRQGVPGSSYAFEVAERIGFSKSFIAEAKESIDDDKTKVETFLIELENKTKKLNDKLKITELENARLSGLTSLYQNNLDKIDKEKKEIINQAKQKADLYLSGVNRQIELTIKNIKEAGANKDIVKQEKQKVEKLKLNAKSFKNENVGNKEEIVSYVVNDLVKIKNTSTFGTIETILDEKSAIITSGSMKLKVKFSEIEPVSKKEQKKEVSKISKISVNYQNLTLDIRGERGNEIEFKVIKFLDDSYSTGTNRVEILHGKGTGVLKKIVWEILKQHHGVNKYYYASIEHGGEGITVVELK